MWLIAMGHTNGLIMPMNYTNEVEKTMVATTYYYALYANEIRNNTYGIDQ